MSLSRAARSSGRNPSRSRISRFRELSDLGTRLRYEDFVPDRSLACFLLLALTCRFDQAKDRVDPVKPVGVACQFRVALRWDDDLLGLFLRLAA